MYVVVIILNIKNVVLLFLKKTILLTLATRMLKGRGRSF